MAEAKWRGHLRHSPLDTCGGRHCRWHTSSLYPYGLRDLRNSAGKAQNQRGNCKGTLPGDGHTDFTAWERYAAHLVSTRPRCPDQSARNTSRRAGLRIKDYGIWVVTENPPGENNGIPPSTPLFSDPLPH